MKPHQQLSPAEMATANNPVPWVIVTSPVDNEYFWCDCATHAEARKNLKEAREATGEKCDIMRRQEDGKLTTDF